jgi:hypothetical protein
MTDISLQQYLEFHCGYLREAVKDVAAHRDLPPLFAAVGADGKTVIVDPKSIRLGDGFEKDITTAAFRTLLAKIQAMRYVIVTACWMATVAPEEAERAMREGTDGFLKDRRTEGYQIVVGDRTGSLATSFTTVRDYKGKIRELRAQSATPDMFVGRFIDLLTTQQ